MTPKALGYRMPAEWEPHQATWLSWPHKEASWPGKLQRIEPVYAQMVAALARSETVHINVNDAAMERHARDLLNKAGAQGDIHFHHFPTNDAWCRDHGAIFVRRLPGKAEGSRQKAEGRRQKAEGRRQQSETGKPAGPVRNRQAGWAGPKSASRLGRSEIETSLAATDWGYNAWGGKYPPFDLDNRIPALMAEHLGIPRFDGGMILEGGSIDVNGQGTLLTTESCLLNPNRNPQLSREQIERRLCDFLGVEQVLWLGDGIVGDDTDGHIDDITRFVAPGTVVTCVENDPHDENYAPLQANLRRLREMRGLDPPQAVRPSQLAGSNRLRRVRPFDIIELPMPPAVVYQGQRLPASYANFYIANRVVLLPGFAHKERDRRAADILQELFPDHEVVQLDCSDLIWGLGAFHCLTQQIPANY